MWKIGIFLDNFMKELNEPVPKAKAVKSLEEAIEAV